MRLKNLQINSQTGKMEIDITQYDKPVLIMIADGRAKETKLPDHGETKVVTHMGKLKRVRFDEGEDF